MTPTTTACSGNTTTRTVPNVVVTSVEQDGWREIAEAVREQFRRQIPRMADMRPVDLVKFVEAMRQAMALEFGAMTFDAVMEKVKREFE
jgi:hypothetical protein